MIYLGFALAGGLFGVGLVISGMTQPSKVIAFLDFFGNWDPSLAFVMLGAIGVHFFAYRYIMKRSAPLFAKEFLIPQRRDLNAKLLVGSGLFGIGWALAGYCPGPGVTSLVTFEPRTIVFVAAMIAGMLLQGFVASNRDATALRGRPAGRA